MIYIYVVLAKEGLYIILYLSIKIRHIYMKMEKKKVY